MKPINCVLLVEDDNITNFLNQRILKGLRITEEIHSVNNGDEGLKFIKNFASENDNDCPELILLDLNMPVLDGFEFMEEFRKQFFSNKDNINVIVLTTSAHENDIKQILKDDTIGYINKPLSEEKLIGELWKKFKKKVG